MKPMNSLCHWSRMDQVRLLIEKDGEKLNLHVETSGNP